MCLRNRLRSRARKGSRVGAVLRLQYRLPLVDEFLPVGHLVGFYPGFYIGAVRDALMVDNLRRRRVERAQAALAERKSQIGIVKIGWRIALVETAQRIPNGFRQR